MYLLTLTDGDQIAISEDDMDLVRIGQDAGEIFSDESPWVIVTDLLTGEYVDFDAQGDIEKIEEFYHD
jgi:hypothetical protein